MLTVENLSVHYGAIRALHQVSCRVDQGEIVALIGANGAGKTTILNTISGIVPSIAGTISFEGEEITKMAPHLIVQRGICQVPEGRRVFARMSVQENLEMGGFILHGKHEIAQGIERAFTLFPRLAERRKQAARTLSGGEQQMLAMGLAPMLVEKIFEIVVEINKTGTTIMLVEQNASMALSIAHRAYVLETGEVVLSGDADELAENPEVRKAYLGE